MKISDLIDVLSDIKEEYGDKYIWSMDGLDFPCPREVEIELVSKLKRCDYGYEGGKATATKTIDVTLDYDGVKLDDRSMRLKDNW
jgi:hypothetical protein